MSNEPAIRLYRRKGFLDARRAAPATTRTTARTRSSCGAAAAPEDGVDERRADPGDRDLLRRDRRRRRARARRSCRASWPPRPSCTRPTAAWCPRWPPATTWARSTRWSTRRSTRPALALGRRRARWPSPSGPGLIGALLVGRGHGQGPGLRRGQAPGDGRPPPRPHRRRLAGAGGARPALREPGRLGRAHPPRPGDATCAAPRLLGQTIDDAAGEAIDKGARLLGPRLSRAGPRWSAWRPGATRDALTASRSGSRGRAGRARLLVRRGQDRAALRRARAGRGPRGRARARRPGRLLPGGRRAAAGRPAGRRRASSTASRRWPWAAASRPTGACASWWPRAPSAPGCAWPSPTVALCTDNAAMIGAAAQFTDAVPWPDYLGLDAVATAPPGGIAA